MAETAITDAGPAETEAETATSVARCIVCRAARVEPFLDLGATALANKFLRTEDLARPEPCLPLVAGFCHGCGHVQLTETVPPEAMFEDYLYISSASDTLREHLYELSDAIVARFPLDAGDLVIDVGCNDGTLLKGFRRYGVRTLGVDPAKNLAALSGDSEIDRVVDFFSAASARRIVDRWGPATIITATNTFPHIPDLRDFMNGIRTALAPGGAFVIEAHYLLDMIEQCAFDTIYHEHVSYWALGPMTRLFAAHGLHVTHVERLPIHHGQLRVFVQRQGEGAVDASVEETLEAERLLGIGEIETYRLFAEQARRIKADLCRTLTDLRGQGKRVVGYGAPAKGNTLLNFLEIGPDTIDYIADRSPLKQGLVTPGSHIPVVPPERLLAEQPEYVLLLAWNFAEEIMRQLASYSERGGHFILPVPEVRIV